VKGHARRKDIATNDPELRRMWEGGATVTEIMRAAGWNVKQTNRLGIPDPGPPAPPLDPCREGESDEQRVWRRFPLTGHKPRWD
jgi:hypothetical protein